MASDSRMDECLSALVVVLPRFLFASGPIAPDWLAQNVMQPQSSRPYFRYHSSGTEGVYLSPESDARDYLVRSSRNSHRDIR